MREFAKAVFLSYAREDAGAARRIASVKHRTVEAPILDRLKQVTGLDPSGPGEIGDGVRDFQDAIIGAGGEG